MNFYLRWLEEMAKLKGLGKGLDALLSGSNGLNSSTTEDSAWVESLMQDIALDKIKAGKYQPRKVFDNLELEELAQSIKANGVLQPVVLRKVGNSYELIAGERRWRASKIAGLTVIPAIIRKFSDQEALAIALIENIQRKDLNIIEEAKGYKRLCDEFKTTHDELARVTSRSRSHITNILRLLNLHEDIQDMLLNNEMDMGHARALLPLPDYLQLDLAKEIIDEDLTTSEVERRVAQLLHAEKNIVNTSGDSMAKPVDPDIQRLETKLADKLGMMVQIKHGRRGNGKITLSYSSLDELDNLLNIL